MNALSSKLETMFSIVYVRHSIDTADAFYDAEMNYLDEQNPLLQEYSQKWTNALLASPFRAQFEEKYGRLMFVNAEMSLKTFSPEIIGELQQESRVEADYVKLIASAQIQFEGRTYTISQLSPLKQDADDSRRRFQIQLLLHRNYKNIICIRFADGDERLENLIGVFAEDFRYFRTAEHRLCLIGVRSEIYLF